MPEQPTKPKKLSMVQQYLQLNAGKPQLRDGPFAEAKEMIGGFFLVGCATKEEAVAIAVACPAARWATVEVREVRPAMWVDRTRLSAAIPIYVAMLNTPAAS